MAATSVEDGFSELLTRMTPSATETQAAKSHRASIEACLRDKFGMYSFFRSGSFGYGTSIRNYSDVDYFAVIPNDRTTQNSADTLEDMRVVLATRFPSTGIFIDAPAVILPFGSNREETTEVTPARLAAVHSSGSYIYDIPSRFGGWMRTSPEVHAQYVREQDERLKGRVRPLIRFLKAWKYYNSVPIRSFYLEMFVAAYASTQSAIIYGIDIPFLMRRLWDSSFADIADPTGVTNSIAACAEWQRSEVFSGVLNGQSRAGLASQEDAQGKTKDAFIYWDMFFNGRFPAYG